MHMRNNKKGLLIGTALAALTINLPAIAIAQDGAVSLDTIEITTNLDAISDATTKTDQKLIETLAGTSLVTQDEVKTFQPDRVSGMLASVPGIEVQEDSDDPGSAINIRGLQDFGRVNVMIDGARQNFQRSGHSADGQFYLEPELVKEVNIVRGPVSTIYGSGAIGGVVNFETLDPADMIRHGEKWAVSVKGQYATNDEGKLVTATGAAHITDRFSAIASFTYRDNEDYEDGNGNEILNTGEEIATAFVKGVMNISEGNTLKLSYIDQTNDYITGDVGIQRDTETRDRTATAKWLFNPTGNDLLDLTVSAYYTSTNLDQLRLDGAFAGNRRNFDIETFGFDIFNSSRFGTGLVRHTLTYGGDYFNDTVETEDPLNNGDEFTPGGERYAAGLFIQDKLEYSDWLEFIAALRYDSYKLDAEDGSVSIDGDRLSPKFTVGIKPFNGVQLYATYAEGYRAPAITETLVDGTHPFFGPGSNFIFVPNPGLTPETARNLEGGINLSYDSVLKEGDRFRAKMSYFHNDVEDYIEGVFEPFMGFPTSCGSTVGCFQYQNIAEAELRGFEIEANYDAGSWFAKIAYSHIRGDNLTDDQPLLSVFPEKLVTTLGARFLENKLTVGGRWTAVAAQERTPVGELQSEDYNLFDLFAVYDVNENFSTSLTLKNITDEQYQRYLNLETDAEPGFSAVISGTIRFGG